MRKQRKKKSEGRIKNATPNIFDGIKFRSKLETYTYKKLKEANIFAEYEQYRYELLPAFIFHGKKVRAMTYLPDFVGKSFVIECKGFANESFPLRKKLFEFWLSVHEPETQYHVVRTQKEVDQLIETLKSLNNE